MGHYDWGLLDACGILTDSNGEVFYAFSDSSERGKYVDYLIVITTLMEAVVDVHPEEGIGSLAGI